MNRPHVTSRRTPASTRRARRACSAPGEPRTMRTLGKIAGCVLLAAAACARPDALPEGTRIAVSASQVTIPVSAGGYSSRVGVELRNSGSGVLVPPTTEVRYPGPSGWLRPNLYVRDQD